MLSMVSEYDQAVPVPDLWTKLSMVSMYDQASPVPDLWTMLSMPGRPSCMQCVFLVYLLGERQHDCPDRGGHQTTTCASLQQHTSSRNNATDVSAMPTLL